MIAEGVGQIHIRKPQIQYLGLPVPAYTFQTMHVFMKRGSLF